MKEGGDILRMRGLLMYVMRVSLYGDAAKGFESPMAPFSDFSRIIASGFMCGKH